jgi:hypothetical protein
VEALSPLSSYPLAVLGDLCGLGFECSNWVVQIAMGFYRLVGLSCEGFEGQLLAILIAIEAEEVCRQHGIASTPKKWIKGSRELRGLKCSINYDSKGSVLVVVREGNGTISFFYEA